jgi:NhaP-type Na+/H+ or K+/H+ antiporter
VPFALGVVAIVVVVAVVSSFARRIGRSAPLLLTVVGVIGSYLPFVPDYRLNPELVLVGLLPPLLYATSAGQPSRSSALWPGSPVGALPTAATRR